MKTDECCAGESCRADTTGRMRCLPGAGGCSAAGYPCAVAQQCCGGFCLPDGSGAYACRDTCAPDGAGCGAPEDCCSGACVGSPGATVCIAISLPPAEPVCVSAGDACDTAPGSCCVGTLCAEVQGGTHACAP